MDCLLFGMGTDDIPRTGEVHGVVTCLHACDVLVTAIDGVVVFTADGQLVADAIFCSFVKSKFIHELHVDHD